MKRFLAFLLETIPTGLDPDRNLARIFTDVDAGKGWTLAQMKAARSNYGSTYTPYAIRPKWLPSYVEKAKDDLWYDTRLAAFDGDYPRLKNQWLEKIPKTSGWVYRGMSHAEYQSILRSGQIRSLGDYNLGDLEKNVTFFSIDPDVAQSYSSGFAPWMYKPTFDRPAYVIAIKDPGNTKVVRDDERGYAGSIPASNIVAVYQGVVYAVKQGELEIYRNTFKSKDQEGSRFSPSVYVAWKRIK
jgi:hypothetical protein